MARGKVKMAFIVKDSERKASLKKRRLGLIKKVEELHILCGVDAGIIIYNQPEERPTVWPADDKMKEMIAKFESLPLAERTRRMFSQESILRERLNKLESKLMKRSRDNREKEMTEVMYSCLLGSESIEPMNVVDLNDLNWVVSRHLSEVNERIEAIMKRGASSSSAAPPAAAADGGASSSYALFPPPQPSTAPPPPPLPLPPAMNLPPPPSSGATLPPPPLVTVALAPPPPSFWFPPPSPDVTVAVPPPTPPPQQQQLPELPSQFSDAAAFGAGAVYDHQMTDIAGSSMAADQMQGFQANSDMFMGWDEGWTPIFNNNNEGDFGNSNMNP